MTAVNSPTPPISQDEQHGPKMDIWETPFERWLRLADALLNNPPIPGGNQTHPPKPEFEFPENWSVCSPRVITDSR